MLAGKHFKQEKNYENLRVDWDNIETEGFYLLGYNAV
jgi:hypothetical protein